MISQSATSSIRVAFWCVVGSVVDRCVGPYVACGGGRFKSARISHVEGSRRRSGVLVVCLYMFEKYVQCRTIFYRGEIFSL